jgi:hypothetical protein
MKILEWTFIIIGGIFAVASIVTLVVILYKMKTSKDGLWRP